LHGLHGMLAGVDGLLVFGFSQRSTQFQFYFRIRAVNSSL
jgi:hypothetical protein